MIDPVLGAEVLGEGIVFGIAALVLFAENRRAAANEVRHEIFDIFMELLSHRHSGRPAKR